MKAPLLHREIDVRLVDTINTDPNEPEERFVFGVTNAGNGVSVTLARNTLSDADFVDTVLHEFMHAVEISTGMDLPHEAIYVLSAGLTQMLLGLKLVHGPSWRAALESQQALEAPNGK